MSAGFKVGDDVLWGSNGAVEAVLGALASVCATRFGPDDPLTAYFAQEHEQFFTGKVVFLDQIGSGDDDRLLDAFRAAFALLAEQRLWTPSGEAWAAAALPWFCARLLRPPPPA